MLAAINADVALPIEIVGLRYGWSYKIWCNNSIGGYCENPKGPVDTLTGQVEVFDKSNNSIYKQTHVGNTYSTDWQIVDQTVRFNKTYTDTELSRITFAFTGKDEGYWAGFYGPKITAVHARLLYKPNLCATDPTADITCPGYAQAVFTRDCNINALSNPQCPGYAKAYFDQQCTANALYDRTCPGYAEAYALAHVVAAPTVTVSAPTVQVSTTGTVSVETPVVSDPVVNEVITRPATQTVTTNATSTVSNTSPTSQVTQAAQTESKTEKKTETKQVVSTKKPETKKDDAVKPVDLNNKDALGVLKTIADYNRQLIDAVKALNGNLYKR